VDTLAGTVAVDNLLILGLDPKKLVEIDRSGKLFSFIDLAGTTTQAIACDRTRHHRRRCVSTTSQKTQAAATRARTC